MQHDHLGALVVGQGQRDLEPRRGVVRLLDTDQDALELSARWGVLHEQQRTAGPAQGAVCDAAEQEAAQRTQPRRAQHQQVRVQKLALPKQQWVERRWGLAKLVVQVRLLSLRERQDA